MIADKLTIAHISDLHRTPDSPISNVVLLNSFIHDLDTYTVQGISKPDFLIVSGDIIQGGPTATDLVKQYDEANSFLTDLATQLFDGDKNRIILTPGNHDISWAESKASMEKILEKEIIEKNGDISSKILKQAFKINTNIKWSWNDRSFYRVNNKDTYNNRLSYFCQFYEKFYDGKRQYSVDPDKQFDIFDFEKEGITIIGYNSCFHNDHLNRAGMINPECIANTGTKLRELRKQGRLLLASWHHNTKGGPYDQDYMDGSFIKNLISYNVKIGFHGHQHRQEILREENNIIDGEMMLILIAGSICAGPSELPPGYNQQYNILELNRINNSEIKLTLYSRVKTPESSFDNPIWDKGTFNATATKFSTTLSHEKPTIPNLAKAEILLGNRKYEDAVDILELHDLNDPIVRRFLLECYEKLENYSKIFNKFSDPQNITECISLINAGIEIRDKTKTKQILNVEKIKHATDTSIIHLREQLKAKIK
ncbi:MAG: metallophosphoesterase [Emcibacter sp.]|nr:metallophosphoesterase [Emcibacter sp.]